MDSLDKSTKRTLLKKCSRASRKSYLIAAIEPTTLRAPLPFGDVARGRWFSRQRRWFSNTHASLRTILSASFMYDAPLLRALALVAPINTSGDTGGAAENKMRHLAEEERPWRG
eukprot:1016059-Pyramimonas_sp.AAC.1